MCEYELRMSPFIMLQYVILSVCINSFVLLIHLFYYNNQWKSRFFTKFDNEYDFVIVGSGTAGSVIAHRILSETNYTFIVLEAGGESNPLFDIPVLGPMLHGSVYDWQYKTMPQENACLAMDDKSCRLPQGKIVGGSSKLNNMIHVRGNISHYIDWFQGKYTEDYITHQFRFVENNILNLSELQYESELANAILEAAAELGYGRIKDFDKGFRKSKVSQKDGKRWSTSDNLDVSKHVLTNVLVEKVNIKNNMAVGIKAILSDRKININARKGVILSAGTYNSPKILQLSGIGPSKVLNQLHIPLLKELPVGSNLQDHITTGLDLILFNKSLSINTMNMLNVFHVYEYFFHGKGPLTTPGCEAVGFLCTKKGQIPDLQFMVMPVGISADRGSHLRKTLSINNVVWDNYFAKTFDKHTATILPIVLHPKSKGHVYINSTDPKTPPCIDPKFFSNYDDIKTLIDGLRLVTKFAKSSAMVNLGAYVNPIAFPGCEKYAIFTYPYWECYVRHLTLSSYHPVGTCSMGKYSSESVVDTSFKVFGIEKLFVADASVLPTLPSGNINAAVAMMASIFFDTNIKPSTNTIKDRVRKFPVCYRKDYIYDYLKIASNRNVL